MRELRVALESRFSRERTSRRMSVCLSACLSIIYLLRERHYKESGRMLLEAGRSPDLPSAS